MKRDFYTIRPLRALDINHPVTPLDVNYIQTGNSIGVGYVFESRLCADTLKKSLAQVLTELPPLAGRLDFKTLLVTGGELFVPFEHVTDHVGAARDYAARGKNIKTRTEFVPEPTRRDILRGKAPLMCVKLTEFISGGAVLGVTINHGLMDAAGFHQVMKRWSDVITGRKSAPLSLGSNVYGFRTRRPRKQRQADIDKSGMAKPLNTNTWIGRFVTQAMFRALDKIRLRGREMIYVSADDVAAIKETVRAESGLTWISTNAALSAHILHAIIPLQMPQKSRLLSVGNVINIRNRVESQEAEDQSSYLGNALYIMVSDLPAKASVHDLTRGEIAAFLRAAFDRLSSDTITSAMQNIVDSLEDGYGYPSLNIFKPIMAVNNQSKFDVYNVNFGAGRPLRVIPQDVGDHIMLFPAADGGIEIYLRDFTSAKRQTPNAKRNSLSRSGKRGYWISKQPEIL